MVVNSRLVLFTVDILLIMALVPLVLASRMKSTIDRGWSLAVLLILQYSSSSIVAESAVVVLVSRSIIISTSCCSTRVSTDGTLVVVEVIVRSK